jgi:hypothetical protein
MNNSSNQNKQSRIIDCINEAHSFSETLGESTSITRDYILNKLNDLTSTEIHIQLIQLNDERKLFYNSEKGVITQIKL